MRGGTHRAVQKAIRDGRIATDSDGRIDSDAADRAWPANTDELQVRGDDRPAGPPAGVPAGEPVAAPEPAARDSRPRPAPRIGRARQLADPPGVPEGTPGTVNEASLLEKIWKARKVELECRRLEGQLVDREEIVARWGRLVMQARDRMLGIPARARQEIEHLTAEDAEVIDRLLREALEALAEPAVAEVGGERAA